MSLIKCPECKQEISDQACICIKCGNPISKTAEQQSSLNTAWNAVTTSRTNAHRCFCFGYVACTAIPGVSATGIDGICALTAFTYTLEIFLAVSEMFFAAILF